MRKTGKADVLMAAICLLLGCIIAVQIKSVTKNTEAISSTENMRAEELQVKLIEEKEKNDLLYQQLLDYSADFDEIRSEASSSSQYASMMESRLESAEIMAGLVPVEGQGVVVTMRDSAADALSGADVIHDSDVLMVINELRDAGAEAISINDERLLATSEIRCAGSTISVNNNRYSTPFVIKAIGEGKALESALNMRRGVVEILKSWDIDISVVRSNKLRIEAYEGPTTFRYASAVKEGG